jgi:hypothetical protein
MEDKSTKHWNGFVSHCITCFYCIRLQANCTEHAKKNSDPLAIKKKVHEAAEVQLLLTPTVAASKAKQAAAHGAKPADDPKEVMVVDTPLLVDPGKDSNLDSNNEDYDDHNLEEKEEESAKAELGNGVLQLDNKNKLTSA